MKKNSISSQDGEAPKADKNPTREKCLRDDFEQLHKDPSAASLNVREVSRVMSSRYGTVDVVRVWKLNLRGERMYAKNVYEVEIVFNKRHPYEPPIVIIPPSSAINQRLPKPPFADRSGVLRTKKLNQASWTPVITVKEIIDDIREHFLLAPDFCVEKSERRDSEFYLWEAMTFDTKFEVCSYLNTRDIGNIGLLNKKNLLLSESDQLWAQYFYERCRLPSVMLYSSQNIGPVRTYSSDGSWYWRESKENFIRAEQSAAENINQVDTYPEMNEFVALELRTLAMLCHAEKLPLGQQGNTFKYMSDNANLEDPLKMMKFRLRRSARICRWYNGPLGMMHSSSSPLSQTIPTTTLSFFGAVIVRFGNLTPNTLQNQINYMINVVNKRQLSKKAGDLESACKALRNPYYGIEGRLQEKKVQPYKRSVVKTGDKVVMKFLDCYRLRRDLSRGTLVTGLVGDAFFELTVSAATEPLRGMAQSLCGAYPGAYLDVYATLPPPPSLDDPASHLDPLPVNVLPGWHQVSSQGYEGLCGKTLIFRVYIASVTPNTSNTPKTREVQHTNALLMPSANADAVAELDHEPPSRNTRNSPRNTRNSPRNTPRESSSSSSSSGSRGNAVQSSSSSSSSSSRGGLKAVGKKMDSVAPGKSSSSSSSSTQAMQAPLSVAKTYRAPKYPKHKITSKSTESGTQTTTMKAQRSRNIGVRGVRRGLSVLSYERAGLSIEDDLSVDERAYVPQLGECEGENKETEEKKEKEGGKEEKSAGKVDETKNKEKKKKNSTLPRFHPRSPCDQFGAGGYSNSVESDANTLQVPFRSECAVDYSTELDLAVFNLLEHEATRGRPRSGEKDPELLLSADEEEEMAQLGLGESKDKDKDIPVSMGSNTKKDNSEMLSAGKYTFNTFQ